MGTNHIKQTWWNTIACSDTYNLAANGAEDQPILITIRAPHHHSPGLRLTHLLLLPHLHHHLTTPIATKARQESHTAASFANISSPHFRQTLNQIRQASFFNNPHNFVNPTNVSPFDEESWRYQLTIIPALHQFSQLLPKPTIHGNVPFAEQNAKGLNCRPDNIASFESFPDPPQGGGVKDHSILTIWGAQHIKPIKEGRQRRILRS